MYSKYTYWVNRESFIRSTSIKYYKRSFKRVEVTLWTEERTQETEQYKYTRSPIIILLIASSLLPVSTIFKDKLFSFVYHHTLWLFCWLEWTDWLTYSTSTVILGRGWSVLDIIINGICSYFDIVFQRWKDCSFFNDFNGDCSCILLCARCNHLVKRMFCVFVSQCNGKGVI